MVAKHQKKHSKASTASLKETDMSLTKDPPLSILDDEEEDDVVDSDDDEEEGMREKVDKSASDKKKKSVDSSAAVIYIGHLPNLLGEKELLKLLKQFGGSITHLRVSRSEKTGNSRGYAFARIKEMEVAQIIVDTLAGYLLFSNKQPALHRRLVCHIVPPDKVHPRLFVQRTSAIKMAQERKLRKQTEPPPRFIEDVPKVTAKLIQQERRKRQAIEKAGIDFTDFPGYEKITAPPLNATAIAAVPNQEPNVEPVSEKKKKKEHKKHKTSTDPPKESKKPKQSTPDANSRTTQPKEVTSDAIHRTNPPNLSQSNNVTTATNIPSEKKRASLGDVEEKKHHKKKHKKSKRHSH